MVTRTVKLGKDNWTKEPAIRIEFVFPPDVHSVSYYSTRDERLKVHFLDGDKYPLAWFVGKSPLQLVRYLKVLRRAAGHGYSDVLDILQRYLEAETPSAD